MPLPFPHINPTKQAYSLLNEFKNFASKGNVIDLAVGVIIGGAFGKIIESMVKNLIMPLVSTVIGGDPENATKGMESLSYTLRGIHIPFGAFLAEFANFLIMAFVLFIFIVKFLGWMLKTKEAVAPPPPPEEVKLLMEIRDLLKAKS